jgi:hypothetical protein
MAAETQYTANTGLVKISTANSNRDGTGTLGTVLTGASNGTLIKNVFIKATGTTSQGMIRLFVYDGSNTRLLREIDVDPVTPSATDFSFVERVSLDFVLKSGHILKASTEIANNFNIIAEGLDFAYYASSVRPESTNYTANTGVGLISTANSNLDGSGTMGTILTAGASGSGWKGCCVNLINIKAAVTTTHGMVRFFVQNTSTGTANTFLISELFVSPVTPSATFPSFFNRFFFEEGFQIQAGFKILVSTENAESFSIVIDAMDWKYPA